MPEYEPITPRGEDYIERAHTKLFAYLKEQCLDQEQEHPLMVIWALLDMGLDETEK